MICERSQTFWATSCSPKETPLRVFAEGRSGLLVGEQDPFPSPKTARESNDGAELVLLDPVTGEFINDFSA
jgi:hypothetical protein